VNCDKGKDRNKDLAKGFIQIEAPWAVIIAAPFRTLLFAQVYKKLIRSLQKEAQ
jgi:hypothetical protein